MKKQKMTVQGVEVQWIVQNNSDFISLTDIAKNFGRPTEVIRSWIKNRNTLGYLAIWEKLHNGAFDDEGFRTITEQASLQGNSFSLSPKTWVENTKAIGIQSKSGRGGGTYAHSDIAFNFCYWLKPEFQVYLIKEFQRLKKQEDQTQSLEWLVKRLMASANFHIHTEAVRENRVPVIDWNTKKEAIYQASEADLLNLALFGTTAREWRLANPKKKGNIRDHASAPQLLVLANLQAINAEFLESGMQKEERIRRLNTIAIKQIQILMDNQKLSDLKGFLK